MRTTICALLLWTSGAFGQPTAWRVDTIAGAPLSLGNGGPAMNALLGRPRHITFDKAGNLYLADTDNHQIRRIGRDGRIVAVAGTGIQGYGGDGGPALAALLNQPRAVALDGNRLYIADSGNFRIRLVNLETGMIEPYAGTGADGFAGDGGPATGARFRLISFLVTGPQGNLLISDFADNRVRRIDRQTGIITTVAGNGQLFAPRQAVPGPEGLVAEADGTIYVAGRSSGGIYQVDAAGTVQRTIFLTISGGDSFLRSEPVGLAMEPGKRVLHVTDYLQCTVRSIALATGRIEIVAGATSRCTFAGDGGNAQAARLAGPSGIAFDGSQLVVSDIDANRIRRIDVNRDIASIAGRPAFTGNDGLALEATLSQPRSAISDGAGGYLVADTGNCVIRRVIAEGNIATFAGRPGVCGRAALASFNAYFGDTRATDVILDHPRGLARDRRGNVYVSAGSSVHRISADDGRVNTLEFDLSGPAGIALDSAEQNLYVVEETGNRVSRISLPTGVTTRFAGSPAGHAGLGFTGDSGSITEVLFSGPSDIAVDPNGRVLVADTLNDRILRFDAATSRVSAIAVNVTSVRSLAVNPDGVLYAISGNRVIRVSGEQRELIAGSAEGGFAVDPAAGPAARFNAPASLRMDGRKLLVADRGNNVIRALTPVVPAALRLISGNSQSAPVRTTLADPLMVNVRQADGTPVAGIGVAFAASAGTLNPVSGLVVTGNDGNASVRLLLPEAVGAVTVTATIAGLPPVTFSLNALADNRPRISAVITAGAFGAAPRIAPGGWIELYCTGFASETREWSAGDFTGATAPTTLGGVRVLINERPAFLQWISPGQINAVAPDGLGDGRVPVQVINAAGNSESFFVEAAVRAPALFTAGGQYAVATLPDGSFAGTAARPARAGDRLVLYGIGFGATTPAVPAGQIARQSTALPNLRVTVGGMEARVDYGGLANGFVGLYQLNIVVPAIPAGNAALAVSVDGTPLTQSLLIAVEE